MSENSAPTIRGYDGLDQPSAGGGDGGGGVLRVAEEVVERAAEVYEGFEGDVHYPAMSAALTAVAPDIAAQARRECAEEAAAWIEDYAGPDPSPASPEWWAGYREAQADAARMVRSMEWSESGRTPPDESS